MKLHRWKIEPSRVAKMPADERALFLMLGHAVNEINVLNKLFYLSNNYDPSDKWRQHAHLTQGLVLARTLIGKLWEGWRLLGDAYFGTQISKTYHEKLNEDASAALRSLHKYFGRDNLVKKLRNAFSFHYDSAEISKIDIEGLNADEMLLYMAETNGNTVFYFSEYAVNLALLEAISPGDPAKAMEALMNESAQVVGWFNETAQGIMAEIADEYLRGHDGTIATEEIDIGSVPTAEELKFRIFLTQNYELTAANETSPIYEINPDT
jgi:hypothetical protein